MYLNGERANRTRQTVHTGQYSFNRGIGSIREHTLQKFRHPPPLSSVGFGGFHFQVHSKETEAFPSVE